ncbi:MAG: hypothetical protein OEM25_04490 [Gammaproteobacteria bacterium]|nr:hypothetical protein [Gammaproteobacteria bacterium]
MDKLAERLRADAAQIHCTISPELDERIRASLQGIAPEPELPPRPRRASKSFSSWWASSLTGVAAVIVLIVVVNWEAPPQPVPAASDSSPQPLVLPSIEWHARTAVLTSPLEQEIENLQSDLKKAEEAVKQDIDRLF